jgi:hypothetical protein
MFTQVTTYTPLEDEMKKESVEKIRIKMRGNVGNYEVGQEIEVSEDEAVKLLSLGYAIKLAAPIKAEE